MRRCFDLFPSSLSCHARPKKKRVLRLKNSKIPRTFCKTPTAPPFRLLGAWTDLDIRPDPEAGNSNGNEENVIEQEPETSIRHGRQRNRSFASVPGNVGRTGRWKLAAEQTGGFLVQCFGGVFRRFRRDKINDAPGTLLQRRRRHWDDPWNLIKLANVRKDEHYLKRCGAVLHRLIVSNRQPEMSIQFCCLGVFVFVCFVIVRLPVCLFVQLRFKVHFLDIIRGNGRSRHRTWQQLLSAAKEMVKIKCTQFLSSASICLRTTDNDS